ncbi:MAG: methyltransferase domain-containing protein [Acidobacteriota bacterium]
MDPVLEVKNLLRRYPRLFDFLQYMIGPVLRNDRLEAEFKAFVATSPEKQFFNLGGGVSRSAANVKNIDFKAGPNVDLIADLHWIPLATESVDGITCVAVVEHLRNPAQLVAETHRILKPGGLAHFNIPFMQPYHASPDDFQRYTDSGLKELFTPFELIKLECMGGPASALTWLLTEFFSLCLSCGSRSLHAFWFLCFTATLWPLKFLDLILIHFPNSRIMTSNFTVLLRKPFREL